jgi:hypothetical protein
MNKAGGFGVNLRLKMPLINKALHHIAINHNIPRFPGLVCVDMQVAEVKGVYIFFVIKTVERSKI